VCVQVPEQVGASSSSSGGGGGGGEATRRETWKDVIGQALAADLTAYFQRCV
jgi:hypothetical protein